MFSNLNQLLEFIANQHDNKIAVEEIINKERISKTYKDICLDVNKLIAAIQKFDLKNINIGIIGENSYNWIVSYFAIVCSGNIAVPLDKEMTDDELIDVTNRADVEAVFFSKTFISTAKKWSQIDKIKVVICFEHICEAIEKYYDLPILLAENKEYGDKDLYKTLMDTISPDLMATIFYSSGTTGANKGIVLTHKQICANIIGATKNMGVRSGSSLAILPIHHCFELCVDFLGSFYLGMPVCICNRLRNLQRDLKIFQPERICMVPAIMEMLYRNLCCVESVKVGLLKEVDVAFEIDESITDNVLYDEFLKRVADNFGGKFPQFIIGGAACHPTTVCNLTKLGFQIMFGYGMTEAAGFISMNRNAGENPSAVGKVFDYLQIKIDEPDINGIGEVLLKGDSITKGYYKDDEANSASITSDGWLRTGDLGFLDSNAVLTLTGRKKSTIILENGENVSPEAIEEEIIAKMPYVSEAIVCQMKNEKYDNMVIGVVMYVDEDTRRNVNKIIGDLKLINKGMPTYKRLHYVVLMTREFDKTSALKKIKRKQIEQEIEGIQKYTIV